MFAKRLAAACAAALLAGCAGEAVTVSPAADHPANPLAAAAPAPQRSATLALDPTPDTQRATAPTAAVYVCPHHPEVTSTNPGDRCPKCNMKLVRKGAP